MRKAEDVTMKDQGKQELGEGGWEEGACYRLQGAQSGPMVPMKVATESK